MVAAVTDRRRRVERTTLIGATRYVIAVKRECRGSPPADLVATLRKIDGLVIRSPDNPQRVQVDATEQAIAEVGRVLGDACHIEALISHRVS